MPTPRLIENAISVGSYGADLERYYLHMDAIGIKFEKITNQKSLKAL